MHTHKIVANSKTYHITSVMLTALHCIPSDQSIRLVVEQSDGTFVCEETTIGPIQVAVINHTKKQLNAYADKLCRMKQGELEN